MELLNKTKAVKLRSHLDKYLVADDNRVTVRQSRNATTRRSIWLVEPSSSAAAIRFRNQETGLYLAAGGVPFLLGWTGKRVIQSVFSPGVDGSGVGFDWEPIRDGFLLKLRTKEGKFLRANGGTPPWRNTVTYYVPVSGPTSNWTLWDVEEVVVDMKAEAAAGATFSPMLSFASSSESGSSPASPISCRRSPRLSINKSTTLMEFFTNAKAVRLRSHHGKYLTASENKESVKQDRNGSSCNARWAVELVESNDDTQVIRLKSCYGKYLTASDHPFLLGMTGQKVLQTFLRRRHPQYSSVEWEPIAENVSGCSFLKLRTRHGNFLRANSGPPPWRKSVTHDVPHQTATQDWILWHVDVVEILENFCDDHHQKQKQEQEQEETVVAPPTPLVKAAAKIVLSDSFNSDSSLSSPSAGSSEVIQKYSRHELNDSSVYSPPKLDSGRLIYYHIADEKGYVSDDAVEGHSCTFKGKSVEELTRKLEEETRIDDIVVCSRSPLNGKLYPLRLHLPPCNAAMRVLVVKSSSLVARNFRRLKLL